MEQISLPRAFVFVLGVESKDLGGLCGSFTYIMTLLHLYNFGYERQSLGKWRQEETKSFCIIN